MPDEIETKSDTSVENPLDEALGKHGLNGDQFVAFTQRFLELFSDFIRKTADLEDETGVPTPVFDQIGQGEFLKDLVSKMDERMAGRFLKFLLEVAPLMEEAGQLFSKTAEEKRDWIARMNEKLQVGTEL